MGLMRVHRSLHESQSESQHASQFEAQHESLLVLAQGVASDDAARQLEAMRQIRQLLSAAAQRKWRGAIPRRTRASRGEEFAAYTSLTFRQVTAKPPIQEVIESGVVPRVVHLLQRSEDPVLQARPRHLIASSLSFTRSFLTGPLPSAVRSCMGADQHLIWHVGPNAGSH